MSEKNIFARDFNLLFHWKLESAGGNPILKKKINKTWSPLTLFGMGRGAKMPLPPSTHFLF